MMSDWSEFSIDELKAPTKNAIAMGPFGSRIKAENFVKSGVPVIKGGNLNGDFILEDKFDFLKEEKATELKTSNAFRRDIVITHRGTIGQVGIIPDNSKFKRYVVSQSQLKVTLDQKKVNPYFVYYFLRSPLGQHRLLVNASQVGVPAIAQASTSVKCIKVPCPAKDIQNKIVEMLLNLDHKIELNRQTNQTLEQIAQAIFKNWFVDFEPVKAKIAAKQAGATLEQIERAAMCAISGKSLEALEQLSPETLQQLKTTAALFPDALVESELGEIPEGWGVKPLTAWGDIICGKTPPKKREDFYGGGIPFIKIPDMHGNMFVVESIDSLTEEGAATQSKKRLPEGSICVSCIATVGQVLITSEESFTNQQINSIVPNEKYFTSYLYFSMLGLYDHLHDLASGGSATLNLNTGNFSKIEIFSPNKEVINAFSSMVDPLVKCILSNYHQQVSLATTRDNLLPRLLSGDLTTNQESFKECSVA